MVIALQSHLIYTCQLLVKHMLLILLVSLMIWLNYNNVALSCHHTTSLQNYTNNIFTIAMNYQCDWFHSNNFSILILTWEWVILALGITLAPVCSINLMASGRSGFKKAYDKFKFPEPCIVEWRTDFSANSDLKSTMCCISINKSNSWTNDLLYFDLIGKLLSCLDTAETHPSVTKTLGRWISTWSLPVKLKCNITLPRWSSLVWGEGEGGRDYKCLTIPVLPRHSHQKHPIIWWTEVQISGDNINVAYYSTYY